MFQRILLGRHLIDDSSCPVLVVTERAGP